MSNNWRHNAVGLEDEKQREAHGYDHEKYRLPLHAAGIATEIARCGEPHGSGLGKTRWAVERTHVWLHNPRRLRVRFERL